MSNFVKIYVPLGHGKPTEEHRFSTLAEALKTNEGGDDIYEMDEKGTILTRMLYYRPEGYWRISTE